MLWTTKEADAAQKSGVHQARYQYQNNIHFPTSKMAFSHDTSAPADPPKGHSDQLHILAAVATLISVADPPKTVDIAAAHLEPDHPQSCCD